MTEYPMLTEATPQKGHKLLLTFSNGEHRVYDFTPNLTHKYYRQLSDETLFFKVRVLGGEIEWATGQDFCPHTLYDDSKNQLSE